MKKRYFIFLPPLLFLVSFFQKQESVSAPIVPVVNQDKATPLSLNPVVQKITATMAAPKKTEAKKFDFSKEKSRSITGLARGQYYLPYIKMIAAGLYKSELGEKVLEKSGMIFFRSPDQSSPFTHTVYDSRRNTLHPIAGTIKIENVDQQTREVLARVYEEYHYLSGLKIQYLQSVPARLMSDYQELTSQGLAASLEVVEALYKPK